MAIKGPYFSTNSGEPWEKKTGWKAVMQEQRVSQCYFVRRRSRTGVVEVDRERFTETGESDGGLFLGPVVLLLERVNAVNHRNCASVTISSVHEVPALRS